MVKLGYKQTDIGAIPIDWDETQIKNVGYLTSGESPAHFDFSIGQIPYFKVEQLNNSVKYQAESPYHTYSTKTIDKGSIIFPKRGAAIATNKVRILGQPSLLDTNIMALTITNEEVHGEYLYYWMVRKGLWQIADTTSVPQINNKHILPLWFPLPPIVEQENIGNALADIDELITIFDRLIEKKKAIKLGAMQELLTGKKRLPGFSGEWQTIPLINALTVGHGMSQHNVESPTGKYPILATGGEIGKATTYLWAKPSVLIGRKGTINKPQYMDRPFWSIDTLFYTKIKEGYYPKFLYYVFCQIDWLNYNEASGVPSLSAKTIESIEVQVPEYAEQIAIADLLSEMDSEIELLEQKLAKYRQLKQGMMQQLLTGKIRLV